MCSVSQMASWFLQSWFIALAVQASCSVYIWASLHLFIAAAQVTKLHKLALSSFPFAAGVGEGAHPQVHIKCMDIDLEGFQLSPTWLNPSIFRD